MSKDSEICDQCRHHCERDIIGRLNHNRVNCLAYGCDKFNETGRYCSINSVIKCCLNLFKEWLLEMEVKGNKK